MGKKYRNLIQTQKGMSIAEFQRMYGTEKKCTKAIEILRWPNGFICSCCDHNEYYKVSNDGLKFYQCKKCGKQTSLLANTLFEQTKLPLTIWFLAMYLITQSKNGISTLELRRMLGVSYSSSWRIRHKLQIAMIEKDKDMLLCKRVEIDDAYLGGKKPGGKAGRGSENKVPFLAAVETDYKGNPLNVIFSKVQSFSKEEIQAWAGKHLFKTAEIITDGLSCFGELSDLQYNHKSEVVGYDRKSVELPCFKWVNTILGNVKTAFAGTFHAFKFEKYAQRYLAEMQYRINRRYDLKTLVVRLAKACVNITAQPEAVLRLSGC
jgi:transposase-like protein